MILLKVCYLKQKVILYTLIPIIFLLWILYIFRVIHFLNYSEKYKNTSSSPTASKTLLCSVPEPVPQQAPWFFYLLLTFLAFTIPFPYFFSSLKISFDACIVLFFIPTRLLALLPNPCSAQCSTRHKQVSIVFKIFSNWYADSYM